MNITGAVVSLTMTLTNISEPVLVRVSNPHTLTSMGTSCFKNEQTAEEGVILKKKYFLLKPVLVETTIS